MKQFMLIAAAIVVGLALFSAVKWGYNKATTAASK
jgi:hypothetical protein